MGGKGALPELVSLNVSAWSLKARFALKHHAIKYRTTPYLPLIGEFKLRLRLWEWRRKVTVPVMFTPKDGVLTQSYDIAVWADKNSARPEAEWLFPPGREEEVSSWNAKSDVVLSYGRSQLVETTLSDPAALRQMVPAELRWLGPLGTQLVRSITQRISNKYKAEGNAASKEAALAVLRETQSALRTVPPAASGARYLLGGALTYADMAMAVAAQVLSPIGPPISTRPGVTLKEMLPYREEFADLIAWRNDMFTRHFPVDTKAKAE